MWLHPSAVSGRHGSRSWNILRPDVNCQPRGPLFHCMADVRLSFFDPYAIFDARGSPVNACQVPANPCVGWGDF